MSVHYDNELTEQGRMSELDEIKESVHGLKVEIAGLRPVVSEIHSHMPRITVALETLARVEEKQSSDKEDHQRIHYRIEGVEDSCEKLAEISKQTSRRVDELWMAHIECQADRKIEGVAGKLRTGANWWDKTRELIARDVVRWVAFGVLFFLLWLVTVNLPEYPPVKAMLEARDGYDSGKHGKNSSDH